METVSSGTILSGDPILDGLRRPEGIQQLQTQGSILSFLWTDKQFVDFILIATSPSTIDKGKDSTSPEEVISVPMDKQQTEEQSREDESEPFKETLSVGPGNLSSFEITIIFKRTQDHVYFT